MTLIAIDDGERAKAAAPLRLLILWNRASDAEMALQELRAAGFIVSHIVARDKEEFLGALENAQFDAVLAEATVSNWTGLEALKEVRTRWKDLPFLIVTEAAGEEEKAECIRRGASDCVRKKHLARLPAALQRALEERKLRAEHTRAEVAPAASEARAREQLAELEMIYRTAPIGLAVYGPDLRYLRVNEHMARMNGLPADKHQGLMTRDVNPDIARAVETLLRRAFAQGESISNVEVHGSMRANAATNRRWLASFHPLRGTNGVLFAISVVVLEITERKRAEEALADSEARNRHIVENSAYGIFRISENGTFLGPNPALLRILGCASVDELNPPILVRDVFRYPAQYAECVASCQSPGELHKFEAEWRRRDGGMVIVRLTLRGATPTDPGGNIEAIAEDVTEVRAMERQLQHSQKFEAIGQLAGGVAHDFNNVVGAILGWAELGLEQSRGNPQIAERFVKIREQAERAAGLTRELLAFARRQVLQPRTVELNTITSGVASFLDKVLRKDIQLKVVNAQLEPIKADSTHIEQVLMNLCLNARDAMPEGGKLTIETEMVDLDEAYCRFYPNVAPGRYAVLSVSDTGVGMSPDTRDRIFEPFFTTKDRSQSSGMGLATAYGVIKQHGGFIHVYSEPGQGSLFRVHLPVTAGTRLERPRLRRGNRPAGELRGTEIVLLADDHDSIREMARQALVSLGYRVLSAVDGEEALRLCENEKPDLAILDLVMPKLGGLQTAAQLASRFGTVPILFTSGYSQESRGVQDETRNARFLQKPYSPSTLSRMVREILDEAQGGAEGI